ncbi:MAG: UTP--glucose-phosphate uridylyltransferase [Thermoleophilaceae bacterium]|nr:UTP--glucose-phosphate uridylyltransferase [Thermoleophilaceae bacterium]
MGESGLEKSVEKMRANGVADLAIRNFEHYYRLLQEGDAGVLPESELEPVEDVPDADDLPEGGDAARDALDRTVVLKLNGGLGTSMGMTRAKSLLEAKDGLTFLDVIARQVLHVRGRSGARLPLVLMNSFYTRDDSLAALERYPDLPADVPLDFVQGKVPKLGEDDLEPVSWPDDPDLEWAPPGHGDLYTSLVTSGMLEQLLDRGYEYAFVSNADNLGATLDERILGWFARERLPFLMEVADRTEADRKGGHLARRRDGGGLVLREIAQTPDDDVDSFQDIGRHRFFNTNTLWVNLRALGALMEERDGVLGLPMIVNRKTVDPGDSSSPRVIQLETAMGAAIDVFDGAAALRVPRERFAPVKTTNDLLVVRSDTYVLTDDARVVVAPERRLPALPLVELDSDHFKLLRDFEARFPSGPPSLVECERLTVEGDVLFGADVSVRGSVTVEQRGDDQLRIDDGATLGG